MLTGAPCKRHPAAPSQIYNCRPEVASVCIQTFPASPEQAHCRESGVLPAGNLRREKEFSPEKAFAEVVIGTAAGIRSTIHVFPGEQSTLTAPEGPAVTELALKGARRSVQETGRTPDVTGHR